MRTKDRPVTIHHYEWSVTRWFTSPTREALDAAGRGIYRELLDVCYTQGAIPSDHRILARMCRSSDEEFERAWVVIGSHFRKHPKDTSALINSHAIVFRNDYFRYIREQRNRGASGGRPKGNHKPHEISYKETDCLSTGKATAKKCKSQHDTTRHDTIQEDKKTNGARATGWDPAPGWAAFERQYPGELIPDRDCRVYVSVIHSEADERLLFENLEAWAATRKAKDGFMPSAQKFLFDGHWKVKPKEQRQKTRTEQIMEAIQ